MSTVLEHCQNVADEVGIERPSSVVGSTSNTSRRLLQALTQTANDLFSQVDWAVLQKEHTFSTVASQAAYALPSDYDRMIPYTHWDRNNEWRLLGPFSPQDWQWIKSGVVEEGPRRRFRIKPDSGTKKFFVSPTPSSAGETLVFEYVSNEWARSSGGTAQSSIQADTDTLVFPDFVVRLGALWRFQRALGMSYADERNDFDMELRRQKAENSGMPRLNMGRDDSISLTANIQDANFPSP